MRQKTARQRVLQVLFPYLLLVGALCAFLHFTGAVADAIHLQRSGVETQGIVRETYQSDLGDTSETYTVAYTYQVGGQTYENASEITWAQFQNMEAGDAIPVFYVPDDPANSRALEAFRFLGDFLFHAFMALVALFFLAGGVVLVVSDLRGRFHRRQPPHPLSGLHPGA